MKTRTFFGVFAAVGIAAGLAVAQVPQTGGPVPDQLDQMRPRVTAGTTQTQAGATRLDGTINMSSPANSGDGVILPVCNRAPRRITVINEATSNDLKVYAPGSDTITNGTSTVAGATGVTQAHGVTNEYICTTQGTGAWYQH